MYTLEISVTLTMWESCVIKFICTCIVLFFSSSTEISIHQFWDTLSKYRKQIFNTCLYKHAHPRLAKTLDN